MTVRTGHYMMPHMLKSQFEALEEPQDALEIDISISIEQIVERIMTDDQYAPQLMDPAFYAAVPERQEAGVVDEGSSAFHTQQESQND